MYQQTREAMVREFRQTWMRSTDGGRKRTVYYSHPITVYLLCSYYWVYYKGLLQFFSRNQQLHWFVSMEIYLGHSTFILPGDCMDRSPLGLIEKVRHIFSLVNGVTAHDGQFQNLRLKCAFRNVCIVVSVHLRLTVT